jgi:predicted nucleic acid-binding protein
MRAEERGEIDRLSRACSRRSSSRTFSFWTELLYISRHRYGLPYEVTLDFFRKVVLPCTEILPIEGEDVRVVKKCLTKLKPSDAIHLATMEKARVKHSDRRSGV